MAHLSTPRSSSRRHLEGFTEESADCIDKKPVLRTPTSVLDGFKTRPTLRLGSESDSESEDEHSESQGSEVEEYKSKSSSEKAVKKRTTNPGRRKVGSRIYDSVFGETCHWCRQKTVEDHVNCSKCLVIRFCGACLLNRHGERISEELEKNVRWVCPKCRGGCGLGCQNCCNCGPCRKTQNLEPTGQLARTARTSGFDNVHDYLIHLKTGESPEDIVKRKHGRGWTRNTGAMRESTGSDEEEKKSREEDEESEGESEEEMEDTKRTERGQESRKGFKRSRGILNEAKFKRTPPHSSPRSEHKPVDVSVKGRRSCATRLSSRWEDKIPVSRGTDMSQSKDVEIKVLQRNARCQTAGHLNPPEENLMPDVHQGHYAESGNSSCLTGHGHEFRRKLEYYLEQPFSVHQLFKMLEYISARKPIMRTRQTRRSTFEIPSALEGSSYLDHHPDFANKLESTSCPEEKMKLILGFLFWLTHSCMDGAFKPWVTTPSVEAETAECMEISGPDCEIIAEFLNVDEDEGVQTGRRFPPNDCEDQKPLINMLNATTPVKLGRTPLLVVKAERVD